MTLDAQLAIDNVEDRVGSPRRRIRCAAARPRASTPFVSEDHFPAVVVERRRVPINEVLVDRLVELHRMYEIRDIQQKCRYRNRRCGQANLQKDSDVVALIRDVRLLRRFGPPLLTASRRRRFRFHSHHCGRHHLDCGPEKK